MEDQRISEEELKAALVVDFDELVAKVQTSVNAAQPGRIIADSEEPVRDAHAEFRRRTYQKALELLQAKRESFSPSAQRGEEQGQAEDHAPDDQRAD
jgi:hypothetical protein